MITLKDLPLHSRLAIPIYSILSMLWLRTYIEQIQVERSYIITSPISVICLFTGSHDFASRFAWIGVDTSMV